MNDRSKTKNELISELTELRNKIKEAENINLKLQMVNDKNSESSSINNSIDNKSDEKNIAQSNPKKNTLDKYRYRTLVENIPGTIYQCEVNSPWRVEQISSAVLQLTGYNPSEFTKSGGLTWADIVYPEDLDGVVKQVYECVTQKTTYTLEYRIIHKNSSLRWVFERGKAFYDETGNPKWLEGVFIDVTEWKKSEQLLKESEVRFKLIFKISPEAITLSKFDSGVYVDVNDSFIRLTGLSREIIIGKTAFELGIESDKQSWNRFINSMNEEEDLINYEIKLNLAKNEIRTCHVSSRLVDYNNEKHLISIFRDISELKNSEDKIKNLNIELEQRVQERTAQLEETLKILRNEYDEKSKAQVDLLKAQEELAKTLNVEKELSAMKSSFISMISHEYRTPLTVILSSSEILRRYFELNQLEQKFYKHLDNINESVSTMTRLLENILVISKSEASSLYYECSKFNIVEYFVRLVHEAEFNDKGVHKFRFNIESENIVIETDQKLMKQVLTNIISNAIKFSSPGKEIISSIRTYDDNIEISVQDFGIGIPEEELPYIYDTFFRAKNSGTMRGSGIGLSVAKRCIDILKGKIEVESRVNEGSKFIVKLSKTL
ncbi:MAG: PAS domain S-box protein [Ignavibacteriae bacterium]|nr:PAS domain S-box protein [Ignavibacteriota bacterium]